MLRWLAAGIVLAVLAAGVPGSPVESGALPSGYARIAFAGDTHGYHIVDNDAFDDTDLLGGVRSVLGKADLFVFNHEGTLIDSADIKSNCRTFGNQSTFAVDPVFAQRLDAGVPMIAAMANNHAMDCGAAGLARTISAFDDAGIAHLGAGVDRTGACAPLTTDVNGVDVAFVSYLDQDPNTIIPDIAATEDRPGVATIAQCNAQDVIAGLASHDLVVVMLHAHWGSSWVYGTSATHRAVVQSLLSWGADLVVSSGPHFPQGVVTNGPQGSLALMGVGNFMFRQNGPIPGPALQATMPLVEIENGHLARAWLYPIDTSGTGLPRLAVDNADVIVSIIDALSRQLQSAVIRLKGLALALPSRQSP